jgi:hypothetical protein
MKTLWILFVIPWILLAQEEHKSPQEIEEELQVAETQFQKALEMFDPWYTGPLVTPSSSMVDPGQCVVQPYIFINDNYQRFNSERERISLESTQVQLKGLFVVQFGLTHSLDITLTPSGGGQWQAHQSGGGFADLPITLGFLVNPQSLYVPKIKFTITETFPTGRYQHLNTNGLALSGFGGGSYQTQFGLVFGKVVNWASKHPINSRLFVGYNIPTPVSVKEFNSYGGGFGTDATVRPGNTLAVDLGLEVSLNQRWVAAMDFVYTASDRTKFHGNPGTTTKGGAEAAPLGGPSNDNFSLAPALEYNWNDSLGILAGIQFSVYGRNSFNFVSGQISGYYAFPIVK